MRFLCLHGMGTNATVFEVQSGPIRDVLSLDSHDEFEFYDAENDSSPAAGIANIFAGPFKTWYAPSLGARSHTDAKALVQEILETEGPFDAAMGFSQGAALLASCILDHQAVSPRAPDLFRLAVFICGSSALNVTYADAVGDEEGTWRRIDPAVLAARRERIRIPTAHVYGARDPGVKESLNLRDMCEPRLRVEFDHGGGHEIPRGVAVTREMARCVRKAVDRAMASH